MTSSILVGTEECPTQKVMKIIKSSEDFHKLYEEWQGFAIDLEINQVDVKRLKLELVLGTSQLYQVVHEVIAIWVGKTGSGATLDKLTSALESNSLTSIADLLVDEFQLKSSQWDLPSYYISRSVITRNILKKSEFIKYLPTSKDIFVFTGVTLTQINLILKNKMVENSSRIIQEGNISHTCILLDFPTHFDKICKIASAPVHLIKADENDDKWVHVQSSDNLSALRNMIDKSQLYLSETEFINGLKSEVHPVCISDSPGMGKTTLVHSIGQQLSKIDNRKILFTAMNEFITQFKQNDVHDERKAALEIALKKLFCSNAGQADSLSSKLNSKNLQIELILDGLDEIVSFNMSLAFDVLKNLSTIPSIRVWVTTRPHLLKDVEDCLNVFGYNIQAFTETNQISFLKELWLSRNSNLVTDRLEQFAEICLTELNATLNRKDRNIAEIPLQCFLIGEVYEEQAVEHSVAQNPNETWIIQINSLVELFERLIEKQYNKYNKLCTDNYLTEEQVHSQHIKLAVQLIFPKLVQKLPTTFRQDVNLNELLKVGLLEKSSTVIQPDFVHRTISEYYIAKFLVQQLNQTPENEVSKFLQIFFVEIVSCKFFDDFRYLHIQRSYDTFSFANSEICHFLDILLAEQNKMFSFDIHLDFKKITRACVTEDYLNLFKTILLFKSIEGSSVDKIFDTDLLILAITYSRVSFLKIILENNAKLLDNPNIKLESLSISILHGRLPQLQYLLNECNLREFVLQPTEETKFLIYRCVHYTVFDSSYMVKQKINILETLLDINPDLLEQQYYDKGTPILADNIHPELLRQLIKRHANVFAKDINQNTILHLQYEYYDLYIMMLEEIPRTKLELLVKQRNKKGETPLLTLIEKVEPTLDVLNKLSELGADFNWEDWRGYSVLARSIANHKTLEVISGLIELGANVLWTEDRSGKTLLHIAGESGNVEAMSFLVNKFKLNMNQEDNYSKFPVSYLIEKRIGLMNRRQLTILIDLITERNLILSLEEKTKLLKSSVINMDESAVEYFLKDGTAFIKNNDKLKNIVECLIKNFEWEPGSKIIRRFIDSGLIEMHNKSLAVVTSTETILLHHFKVTTQKGFTFLHHIIDEYNQKVNDFFGDPDWQLEFFVIRI